MTPAEKFTMAMAEGGYPVWDLEAEGDSYSFCTSPDHAESTAFWSAVHKAEALCGHPIPCCLSCYVAIKVADPWAYGRAISCEHVEAMA